MTRFDDLTEEQLVALSDDDINKLVERECAEAGISFLPTVPPEPVQQPVIPDGAIYSVGGFEFTDRADAEAVALMVVGKARARTETDYSGRKYQMGSIRIFMGTTFEPVDVTSIQVYSEHSLAASTHVRAQYAAAKSARDEALAHHVEVQSQRAEVAQRVWDRVHTARSAEQVRATHRANFHVYMTLADGSVEVAMRFFDKSYPRALEQYPELRAEFEAAELVVARPPR